jgi:hypothetical protein
MSGRMKWDEVIPIDLTSWFDNVDWNEVFTEKLREVFKEEPPILFFKLQFSKNELNMIDPVMLCVDLPLTPNQADMVSFGCSLEEAVDDVIDSFQNFNTGKVIDDDGRRVCGGIALRLRELADKLESSMKQ